MHKQLPVPQATTTQCMLLECKYSVYTSDWKEKHHQRKLQWVIPPRVQGVCLCWRSGCRYCIYLHSSTCTVWWYNCINYIVYICTALKPFQLAKPCKVGRTLYYLLLPKFMLWEFDSRSRLVRVVWKIGQGSSHTNFENAIFEHVLKWLVMSTVYLYLLMLLKDHALVYTHL